MKEDINSKCFKIVVSTSNVKETYSRLRKPRFLCSMYFISHGGLFLVILYVLAQILSIKYYDRFRFFYNKGENCTWVSLTFSIIFFQVDSVLYWNRSYCLGFWLHADFLLGYDSSTTDQKNSKTVFPFSFGTRHQMVWWLWHWWT